MKKLYQTIATAAMLAAVAAVSLLIMLPIASARYSRDGEEFRITASFYPVYVAALNIAGDIEGVSIQSLMPARTGCLHDVQLSADELITLGSTHTLIINGAGAESFLERVMDKHPNLTVIDSSDGLHIPEHDHNHDHDHDHGHDHSQNEHIWMSPSLYIGQVENIRDGLIALDPDHAEQYTAGAAAYIEKIQEIAAEMSSVPRQSCITFHGSLEYLTDELGFDTLCELTIGEDSTISAATLREAADAASGKSVVLLYDNQYPVMYESVGGVNCRIAVIDTAVLPSGTNHRDAWLDAMRYNIRQLQ